MNRPKPTVLKVLQGNPGKRKLNDKEPKPIVGIPKMPEWLKTFPVAVEEWKREGEILSRTGVLTEADANILANRCYIQSQIVKLAQEIAEQDYVVYQSKMDSLGNEYLDTKSNPRVACLDRYIREHRHHGTLLGLDPSSRSKLQVLSSKEDPLDDFLNAKN